VEPNIDDVDPLYEPSYVAFAYGAWAAAGWAASPEIGSLVLVAAAAIIAIAGVRARVEARPNKFLVDFATMLLFCSAAIAAAVLGVDALAAIGG
jgi:Flp pilus assembly protein TadB